MPTSLQDFESVFPKLVDALLQDTKSHKFPANATEWFEKSLKANAIGGKCNRGLSVPDTVAILKGDASLTQPSHPEFERAAELGWMIELLQAFFLVSDDIMDDSVTRRGQACWFRQPGVGMVAINDAFMLESALYTLLRAHFRAHPAYIDLVELFQDVTWRTELGQSCDLLTAPEDDVDLARFSLDKYRFIVRYKTAFYSFYLPVALALHYTQTATPRNLQQAHDILIPMGEYFQVQDDYLDCFADPSVLGKVGTDITDNKCSWLVNVALARASPDQRKLLDDNYGRKDKACEARVKALFTELRLDQAYLEYEDKTVAEIRSLIANVDESEGLKREVFTEFLRKIYRRSK